MTTILDVVQITVSAPARPAVTVSPSNAVPVVQVRYRGTQVTVEAGVQKYSQLLDGTSSPEAITHNLGTQDVIVSVYNTVTGESVEVDWNATSDNWVTVHYEPDLGPGYKCVVIG